MSNSLWLTELRKEIEMAKTSGGIRGAVQNLPVELDRDLPNLFRDLQKRVLMQQRFNMYLLTR